jgi:hypothetical protein
MGQLDLNCYGTGSSSQYVRKAAVSSDEPAIASARGRASWELFKKRPSQMLPLKQWAILRNFLSGEIIYLLAGCFSFFHFHFSLEKEVPQWKEREGTEGLPSSSCWW